MLVADTRVFSQLLKAIRYAAEKHKDQRRKDVHNETYLVHPIEVLELLFVIGGVQDINTLSAAVLHDVIEDTDTTAEVLEEVFGEDIVGIVREVSDDRSLTWVERKQAQIDHAPTMSPEAQVIKLADKLANTKDLGYAPPPEWTEEKILANMKHSDEVVAGLRGVNPALERMYDVIMTTTRRQFTR